MDPYVGSTRLVPTGQRELMLVCRKVAKPVHGGGRAVRHYALVHGPLPCRRLRGKLEPGCPEVTMVRYRCTCELVHAVGDPFEPGTGPCEPVDRGRADPSVLYLSARDQAPLVLG